MAKVTPLPIVMSDEKFLSELRRIASDSSQIILTVHAKQRMKERKISFIQVIACLKKGIIDESPCLDMKGNWKATLVQRSAGDVIKVSVAINKNAIIITVMK